MRFVLLICLFCRLAAADPRAAPTSPEALEHFNRGNQLFSVREFQEAIAEYKAGALIESAPVFNLALAQSYRMLDDCDNALWYYHQFIATGKPEGKVLDGVNVLITQILEERERRPRVLAPAPAPTFRPLPPPPSHRSAPWYHDRLGWWLTGAGVLVTSAGTYLLIDGMHLHNEANTDPSQARRLELHDTALSRYKLGGVGLGLGLAVAGIGVVRFSVHTERSVTVAGSF